MKDHFNQTQAEFKKATNGQSKHAAQKKRGEKKGERQEVCRKNIDRLFPRIDRFLQ